MPGGYNGGAVYNWHLHNLKDKSTGDLQTILDEWTKRSAVRKFFAYCNIFVNWELKLQATRDLIAAHENPGSEIAEKIKTQNQMHGVPNKVIQSLLANR